MEIIIGLNGKWLDWMESGWGVNMRLIKYLEKNGEGKICNICEIGWI